MLLIVQWRNPSAKKSQQSNTKRNPSAKILRILSAQPEGSALPIHNNMISPTYPKKMKNLIFSLLY
eukprot:10539583-Ditylum_brightwellii.AAC.1